MKNDEKQAVPSQGLSYGTLHELLQVLNKVAIFCRGLVEIFRTFSAIYPRQKRIGKVISRVSAGLVSFKAMLNSSLLVAFHLTEDIREVALRITLFTMENSQNMEFLMTL